MPQQPNLRDLLFNTPGSVAGNAMQGLQQVGVPQQPKTGSWQAPPEQPGYFDNYLQNVVNFLKTAQPQGLTPYQQSQQQANTSPVPAVNPQPQRSAPQLNLPAPTAPGPAPSQNNGIPPLFAQAISPQNPYSLDNTSLEAISPQKMWTPSEAEISALQGKRKQMNTDQALAGLASAKDPMNYTGRLG